MNKIHITQYKWAGSWGPFTIKISCGECGLNENIIKNVIDTEFSGQEIDFTFTLKDWLPNWWRIILKGGWHAPITTVNGHIISQGKVLDRNLLIMSINDALNMDDEPKGNVVFYQDGCGHCTRAEELLESKGISYKKYNVVTDPLAARRMFTVVKKHIGKSTPVTTPQIWLDGVYIGGEEALKKHFNQ